MRYALFIATLTLTLLCRSVAAADYAAAIAEYMEGCAEVNQFNGSVLVAKDDEVIFARGFGMANFEHDVPNQPNTKFRIGSITKQFTAMAILVLEERGKLRVTDPISQHLQEAPETWRDVTVHHLLTHTSGIPSFTGMPDYPTKMMMPQSAKEMLARFKDRPLEFEPGERFNYSNSGYYLLGVIVERASGKSYERFLDEDVLQPIDLNDTGYDRFRPLLKHRATGYRRTRDGVVHDRYLDMSQPSAAGAMYSTVQDLNRWDRALRKHELISDQAYERMYQPEKNNYAYGWLVREGKRTSISHGGGINGFLSHILRFPDEALCVVVLCNAPPADPAGIARDLAAIMHDEPYDVPRAKRAVKVDEKTLDAYTGDYELSPGFVVTIGRVAGGLSLTMPGQEAAIFLPNSNRTFFGRDSRGELVFALGKEGQVESLQLRFLGINATAELVDE